MALHGFIPALIRAEAKEALNVRPARLTQQDPALKVQNKQKNPESNHKKEKER